MALQTVFKMSEAININPEKEPIPRSWVPRVITGGKEPPSEYECWLEKLPINSIFVACKINGYLGAKYTLLYKGEIFYLLTREITEGYEEDVYVHPRKFCNEHQDYEVLGLDNPPKEEEDNEQRNRPD